MKIVLPTTIPPCVGAVTTLFVAALLTAGCQDSEPSLPVSDVEVELSDVPDGSLDIGDTDEPDGDDAAGLRPYADPRDGAEPDAPVFADTLTVMSFNVMCSFCVNSDHPEWEQAWDTRVPWLQDVILRHDPDLIGLQELAAFDSETNEVELFAQSGEYNSVFYRHVDDDPLLVDYPDSALLFRAARFELLAEGVFWLGPNPDVSFSGGWAGGNLPRLVTWARLRDRRDAMEFVFVGTHFDNNSPNQERSAELVTSRIGELADGLPILFVGDFNSRPDSTAYATLVTPSEGSGLGLTDTFDEAPEWQQTTNQDPQPAYSSDSRIDHIFVRDLPYTTTDWSVDTYGYGEDMQYPSDHLAIVATLQADAP
jgi:endonuclease/exonuclease/phosphatase family metal-dependent hydrolase